MKIFDQFKTHATVHFCWTIAVLAAIIIALLSKQLGTNDSIKDILSFAVSLASLVLALVAIVQALISSGSLSEAFGSIHSAVEQLKGPTSEVSQAAKLLSTYSERLDVRAGEIERHLSAINTQPQPSVDADIADGGPASENLAPLLSRTTVGGRAAYYACVLSYETKKPFNPLKAFSGDATGRYVQGFIACLESTETIDLNRVTKEAYKVEELKDLEWLLSAKEALAKKVSDQWRKQIDAFFAPSGDDQ